MKMAVICHSRGGTTKKMGEIIAEGMASVSGVEARVFSIDAVDADFVKEAKCVVVGTPTYLATMSAEMKTWLDSPSGKFDLAGKIGGAYATADYIHGGSEIAIQAILSHLLVRGMLVYSGGGAHGKPVIHLGPVAIKDNMDACTEYCRIYGQRMATKTMEIFR